MNTFTFRPHCGESGDELHLATAYLLGKTAAEDNHLLLLLLLLTNTAVINFTTNVVVVTAADGINHGINLEKTVTLMYLFYLDQIGKIASGLGGWHYIHNDRGLICPYVYNCSEQASLSHL